MRRLKNVFLLVVSFVMVVFAAYYAIREPAMSYMVISKSKHKKEEPTSLDESQQELVYSLGDLHSLNPDIVGYLSILGSDKGCFVVQNKNNDYYKKHDFMKNLNVLGAAYFETESDIIGDNNNNSIFGSGITDEQLGFLSSYRDIFFLMENPLVYFETVSSGIQEYEVIAVCYADENEPEGVFDCSKSYIFEDRDEFLDFAVNLKLHSIFNVSSELNEKDRFLTFAFGIDVYEGAKILIVTRSVNSDFDITTRVVQENDAAVYPTEWYRFYEKDNNVDIEKETNSWLRWLGVDIPEEKKEEAVEVKVPTVDDNDAQEIIGVPIDTSEGTGTAGPGSSGGGGNNFEFVTENGMITVTSASTGKQISGTPLEIVSMIVEAEVGSSFHPEAIKAQAVAVVTYLKYSYKTSSAPVVPLLSASKTVKNYVAEVINTGMYYNGSIIYSPYCSSMAGKSNACHEVWVQNLPYLVSVESKYDDRVPGYTKTYTYSKDEMKKILEKYYEISLSDNPDNWIKVIDYTSGGYVGNMSIDDQYSTTGSRFRANCMYIRSAAFTHSYDAESGVFTITTSAYGHGVGMSQYGANYYASLEGMNYFEILSHYYTGITLSRVEW